MHIITGISNYVLRFNRHIFNSALDLNSEIAKLHLHHTKYLIKVSISNIIFGKYYYIFHQKPLPIQITTSQQIESIANV